MSGYTNYWEVYVPEKYVQEVMNLLNSKTEIESIEVNLLENERKSLNDFDAVDSEIEEKNYQYNENDYIMHIQKIKDKEENKSNILIICLVFFY